MCCCWVENCIRKACRLWESLKGEESGRGGMTMAAEMVEEWKEMIVALCVSSAIGIATVSVQIETNKRLPTTFQFLSIAVLLCFGFVGFAKMTKPIFKTVSKILYCVGGFLGFTAFFLATAIPYAPYFQIIIFILYLIFCFIFMLITTIHNQQPSSTTPPLWHIHMYIYIYINLSTPTPISKSVTNYMFVYIYLLFLDQLKYVFNINVTLIIGQLDTIQL